ncbi:hypothetical protein EB796_017832 [Bugula neritina]|uniref:Uncharacterized protein n=1 Tax=Bugula neritina TaxID=10212 RepID=A0A7J7JC96_BUGNE|nr:hypothetical protein EB796_017832 [Bugula neritina]
MQNQISKTTKPIGNNYYDKVMITFLLKYKRQTTDSLKAGNSPFISSRDVFLAAKGINNNIGVKSVGFLPQLKQDDMTFILFV